MSSHCSGELAGGPSRGSVRYVIAHRGSLQPENFFDSITLLFNAKAEASYQPFPISTPQRTTGWRRHQDPTFKYALLEYPPVPASPGYGPGFQEGLAE